MPKIQITTTAGSTLEFDLSAERARIGRAEDNDFVVPDGSVSSYHGEIFAKGDSIEIHDLGSTNGTIIGGQRVEQAVIAPGEVFQLGSCSATVVGFAAAEEPAESDVSSALETEQYEEAPAPAARATSHYAAAPVALTGLGATPCPTQLRKGFGAKTKKKGSGGGGLLLLGVAALVVCAVAAFMIMGMSA